MARTKTKTSAPEFAEYIDKDPSESTRLFVDWLERNTGYEIDETSVKLARVLVGTFQKSEENQARLAERKEANEAARREREAKKAEREKAKSGKAAAPKRKSRKAASTEEDVVEDEPKPAAKKTASRKRRRPAASTEGI